MKKTTKAKLKELGKKLGVSIAIGAIGVVSTVLIEAIPSVQLGSWTPVVTAAMSVIANGIRKLVPILSSL